MIKRNSTPRQNENINKVAETFKQAHIASKNLESTLKESKERLIAHAKENPDLFVGSQIRHDNGVVVKRSSRVTPKWNDNKVSVEWIEKMLNTESADAISISIDHKKLSQSDVSTTQFLHEIDYEELISTYWSVTVSTVD